jgi:hypothetical protein
LLKVSFQGAPAAAFVFDSLLIPDKGKIFVYSPKSPDSYFEITNANIVNGRTSTPPFTLGPVVIEYVENNSMNVSEPQGSFKISEAFFIYKGSDGQDLDKELGASGPCHVNINCSPEGDNWQNQKRGVAKILLKVGSNLYVCTGALVNNTKQDGTPYFLTAEHCGGSASEADRSVWQFYFNYEQTGCPNVGTPPNHVITGRWITDRISNYSSLVKNHLKPGGLITMDGIVRVLLLLLGLEYTTLRVMLRKYLPITCRL